MTNLSKLINIKFSRPEILEQALVHRSSLNENHPLKESNERLEFLGDAVLELWVSEYLYTHFSSSPEGILTNLRSQIVRTENLAKVAAGFNLGDYIYLSKGEETHGGRLNQSILADTFESILGAIYLDSGFPAVNQFLTQFLLPGIIEISALKDIKDPKSQFQEIAQSLRGITPHYLTISETGPDHQKEFLVGAYLDEELIAQGTGASKQKAEEAAATNATAKLRKNNNL
jgi:ribonuclease III